MSKARSKVQNITALNDRVFFFTLLSQVFIASAISGALAIYSVKNTRTENENKIRSVFGDYEKRITEAAYIETIVSGRLSSDLPINEELRAAIGRAGVPVVSVKFENCEPAVNALTFKLSVGQSQLTKCLQIEIAKPTLPKQLIWMILAGCSSLLIITGIWYFVRRKVNESIIFPLITTINEESRRAAIGRLAASVAHDIRSPLTALNFIARSAEELTDDKRKLISEVVSRIDQIAKSLLTLHRAELIPNVASSKEIVGDKEESIDVLKVITNIINEKASFGKKIIFVNEAASVLSASVVESDFSRALSNIIDNAFDVSEVVTCRLAKQDRFFKISICDDGPGFGAEIIASLGKRPISVGKENGNGLGLYNAVRFANRSGGKIEFFSSKNGSQVHVLLPVLQTSNAGSAMS